MKAIMIFRTGEPSVLEYVDVATPKPGPQEVLVKADTIGVNRPELLVRSGTYWWMPPLPAIPGIEMAGVVAEVGADVGGVSPGEKVFVNGRELEHRAGCYAEYLAVPATALRPLPDEVDLQAAACLSSYQVAYHVLHLATRGVIGDSVLIDQASGAIGSAAVQLAKLAGISTVIAIVGSAEKARRLREFGADHAIDHSTEDVVARAREITDGEGVDLVLNAAGGKTLNEQLAVLAPLGLAVSYGILRGPIDDPRAVLVPGGPVGETSPAIRFFNMHTFDHRPEYYDGSMRYLIDRLADGEIDPLVHQVLPLEEARRAHELLEARQVTGKVLLKPAH